MTAVVKSVIISPCNKGGSFCEFSKNEEPGHIIREFEKSRSFCSLFSMGYVVVAGLIYEGTKKTVVVYADGEKQETRTHADTVEEFSKN